MRIIPLLPLESPGSYEHSAQAWSQWVWERLVRFGVSPF